MKQHISLIIERNNCALSKIYRPTEKWEGNFSGLGEGLRSASAFYLRLFFLFTSHCYSHMFKKTVVIAQVLFYGPKSFFC